MEKKLTKQNGAEKKVKPQGFAAMSKEARTAAARKGGQTVSQNRAHMAQIGRKGGETSRKDSGKSPTDS